MDLNKEKVLFDQTEMQKFNVNVSVKELMADGVKLLNVTAYACCGRCEVLNNEVIIEGVVNFCAIVSTEDGIKKINRSERFGINEAVEGATPKSYLFASACTNKVRGFNEAGNLMLAASVDISACMITPVEIECFKDVEGDEYRKKTSIVPINKIELAQGLRFSVSDETELSPRVPEINEILNTCASVIVKEAHVAAGQLIIGGRILNETVYLSKDEYEPIVQVTDGFDFSQIVDIKNSVQGQINVNLNVEEIATTVSLNEQGEMRKIVYSIGLCGYMYSYKKEDCEILSDMYSLKRKTVLDTVRINATDSLSIPDIITNKNISVRLPEGKTPIARINSVVFSPCVCSCTLNDSKAFLKCNGEASVIYTASGTGENEGFNSTVEFDIIVENDQIYNIKSVDADIVLNDIQAVMISGNEIEIRGGFVIKLNAQAKNECTFITDLSDNENESFPEFGIIIYNTKKNDDLWLIGKQYGVDTDDILKLNPDITEPLTENQRIYIFRKLLV